ncbi:MAG TPA: NADH-ubiquinone oxidoreductase-F iron-sulfur binding region domain-containing protein [Propionibacteriaceae bacterium]
MSANAATLLHSTLPRQAVPTDRTFPDQLLARLDHAGLTGRGGGAFPTAVKIASARGRQPRLIVNACDGEPLVAKDTVLLETSPGLVLDGAALVAQAVGASEIVVAVHAGTAAETQLRALVADRRRWRVLAVPARYVSSEASSLVSLLDGGEARPLDKEQPLTHGRGRHRAALVLNAETLAQVALIWAGHAGPLSRLVTVTGAVATSGVVEADETESIAGLITRAGGLVDAPQAVLIGGYSGSWLPWSAARYETIAGLGRRGVPLGAGLVHVLGQGCPIPVVGGILGYLAGESAGQCGPCMFGLPALAQDWNELADPARSAAAQARLTRRLPVVNGRGACRHPDGVVTMAATALSTFATHLVAHQHGDCRVGVPVLVGAR